MGELIPVAWDAATRLKVAARGRGPEAKIARLALKEIAQLQLDKRIATNRAEAYRILAEGCKSHPNYRAKVVRDNGCEGCEEMNHARLALLTVDHEE